MVSVLIYTYVWLCVRVCVYSENMKNNRNISYKYGPQISQKVIHYKSTLLIYTHTLTHIE